MKFRKMITFGKRRFFPIFTCSFIIIFLILCFQFNLFIDLNSLQIVKTKEKGKTIIWWTEFITGERHIHCQEVYCLVTDNRNASKKEHVAYLFYGTYFNKTDLPLPRNDNIWGLLHEESPRNSPLLNHEPVLSLFNYSSTFSRYSDFPLTLQYLPSLESITSLNFFKTFQEKNSFNLAPIIYVQSDCVTPNNRDSYVTELMKYVQIDSYGSCLNNKKLQESSKDPVSNMMSPDLLELVGRYKFAIAFENAICEDYITEKLWRPLVAGSIPLYVGSPSVKDWLPNNYSIISPMEFLSPKELAKFLVYVSSNENVYNTFLNHKLKRKIDNSFLINSYNHYSKLVSNTNFVQEFECIVCQRLHKTLAGSVSKKHYDCPEPVSIVSNKYNASNWWHADYFVSKCEANLLRSYIDQGLPISQMKFNCW